MVTPEEEEQWATAINLAVAQAVANGSELTVTKALLAHMGTLFTELFTKAGHAPDEARRLARQKVKARAQSPQFPKLRKRLRERLSRVRRRLKTRR
jgi:hypothetical protein